MEKISELLKKWSDEQGVEREEYAVHDSEGFPDSMYSEAMGEDSFQEVIDLHEALDDSDFSMEVIEKYMNYKGHSSFSESIEEMKDNYVGKYDDIEDFAYETVESMGGIEGISDADRYLYVTDTDRRLVSNEQADDDIENMDDDDILERAEMKDEYDEAIDNEKEEEAEAILEKAKEAVHDEIYEEWHKGLEDPYSFLVDEQGLYDSKSILKANFVVFDYKEFGEALEQDYHVIETDGDIMVFQYN
jgi:antirestriction protein